MMNVTMLVGEKRRFQGCWTNGTAASAAAWTVTPTGPILGTPTVVTDGDLSGSEVTFEPATAGVFVLQGILPLTDGQKVATTFQIRVK